MKLFNASIINNLKAGVVNESIDMGVCYVENHTSPYNPEFEVKISITPSYSFNWADIHITVSHNGRTVCYDVHPANSLTNAKDWGANIIACHNQDNPTQPLETWISDNTEIDPVYNEVLNSYIEAALFVDENFDGMSVYQVCERGKKHIFDNIVTPFVNKIKSSSVLISEACAHGWDMVGHDLYMQSHGHGVGFWEQDSTKSLNNTTNAMIAAKILKEMHFHIDDENNDLICVDCL